ncbi:MAG: carbamoyltransferase HypF [Calditrichaeota bacterium]|nr:MAG: carbamoyltransferase HypF [Calditrichota bacterium]
MGLQKKLAKQDNVKSREKIIINGIVQGVGFRPFVYSTAKKHQLSGYVCNDSDGVVIEVEGRMYDINNFHTEVINFAPPVSKIHQYSNRKIKLKHDAEFEIKESHHSERLSTFISPDLTVCNECLAEMFDPNNRRYLYPLINCTNCGPRYTIINKIPYDRIYTSMNRFTMCRDCLNEYRDPTNRRFHAQPNCCPKCGPKVFYHNGKEVIDRINPIQTVIEQLHQGNIVAVKGIGGFHLACDAYNESAIQKLRLRKGRAEKPFALMVPDLKTARKFCVVSKPEEVLLLAASRPIVLLRKRANCPLPESIAPDNNFLGIMIAYSPLHHLLLKDNFEILVMTSANLAEEPIVKDNDEAIKRLHAIADIILLHDRDILQRSDDSIIRKDFYSTQILRRSRGYVPLSVNLQGKIHPGILAVGGEQKNTVALSRQNSVFLSQYIGDLDNPESMEFFKESISHLSQILKVKPEIIACDLHPEYLSTKYALGQGLPVVQVQHHHAHMVSVMAENNYTDTAIGLVLDGTGYGTDGTIWGGEILVGNAYSFERFAYLKPVPLPGGSKAILEPWRMALSYLYNYFDESMIERMFSHNQIQNEQRKTVIQMINKNINAPLSSSCGRLFDAVASLLHIKHQVNYDAQAAIALESVAMYGKKQKVELLDDISGEIDISNLLKTVVERILNNYPVADIALYFHQQLAEYFIAAVQAARNDLNLNTVALSGGVFQNKLFSEYIYKRLSEENFNLLVHTKVPVNDGGLSLGQVLIANEQTVKKEVRAVCV